MVSYATTSEHKSVAANNVIISVSMIKEKIGKYGKKANNSGSYRENSILVPEVCSGNIGYDKLVKSN